MLFKRVSSSRHFDKLGHRSDQLNRTTPLLRSACKM